MNNIEYIFDIIKSGTNEIISEDELKNLIIKKKKLIIKVGFDPTSKDLHLGHFIILQKLKQLQCLGYFVCFIIGDFTSMIGDPSGRSNVRKQLNEEEISSNYRTYYDQIFKILNSKLTNIYFNSSWFVFLGISNILKLLSLTTVSRILERNDFKLRFDLNKPIGINEIIYPFLQSYDSIFIESDIEIGGIDQKFNFLLSRYLQKKYNQKSQVSIMMPILTGIDGKQKMSKSLKNCINIKDDPYDMFCKVMSIPDFLIKEYFIYLMLIPESDYLDFSSSFQNPMDLKIILAKKIVSLLHDDFLSEKARFQFLKFFSKKELLNDLNEIEVCFNSDKVSLFDVLFKIKFISSHSEFKRFLKFKSIKINGDVIVNKNFYFDLNLSYFLQVGKKKIIKIFLKSY